VNVGLSVSRVGGDAQTQAMRAVAGGLRLELAQYREVAAFAQFGSDLDASTRRQLDRGERLMEILKQGQYEPQPVEDQVISIRCGTSGAADGLPIEDTSRFLTEVLEYMRSSQADLVKVIAETGKLNDDDLAKLDGALTSFRKDHFLASNVETAPDETD